MQLPRLLAFVAILSALSVISAPAGGASGTAETCGLPIAIQDPDIRAAFVRFEQNQSTAAAKACAYFRNDARQGPDSEVRPSLPHAPSELRNRRTLATL